MEQNRPTAQTSATQAPTPDAGRGQPATPDGVARFHWVKIAEPISIAGLFIFMLGCSWLRWMDPLIDFPRDLYMAWRLSEGDLLYVKLANYYGPLAQLIEAGGFRVFGVGLGVMVGMNIGLAIVVLLLLRAIFGAVGNRLSMWLCSVAFLAAFVVGHYSVVANANFIAPYVAQAAYGFAGLLLLLWGLLRNLKTERSFWLGVAGLGLAIAYLDKPEPLLAGLGALGLYFLAQISQRARHDTAALTKLSVQQWIWRAGAWLAGGFGILWFAVFLFFLRQGGVAYAWLAVNYVPHTLMDGAYREVILHSSFMQGMLGVDHPVENFFTQ